MSWKHEPPCTAQGYERIVMPVNGEECRVPGALRLEAIGPAKSADL